jgi:SPP1 gp7 family putative phage head morphogenesis protein
VIKLLKVKRVRAKVRWRFPTLVMRSYQLALTHIFNEVQADFLTWLEPRLRSLLAQARLELGHDSSVDQLKLLLEGLTLKLALPKNIDLKLMLINIGQKVSKWNDREWRAILRKVVGVDVNLREPWLATRLDLFADENLKLINDLADKVKSDVEKIVRQGVVTNLRYEEIAKQLTNKLGMTKTHARLIARDQVNKFNGQLTMVRQKDMGIRYYSWETADDARVRGTHGEKQDKHNVLDGVWCDWSDPTKYSSDQGATWNSRESIRAFVGIPGQDYQCRCWAKPIFEEESRQ